MDIYLPADFRELHATAPDDWRDASSTTFAQERVVNEACDECDSDNPQACADPLWRVI